MSKSEELTDQLTDDFIRRVQAEKITVLTFEMEGSKTQFKVTKVVSNPKPRIWGREIVTTDMDTGMTHYGHEIDVKQVPAWCDDCNVPVTKRATVWGNKVAEARQEKENGES